MDERVEKWLDGQEKQLRYLLSEQGKATVLEKAGAAYDLRLFALIRAQARVIEAMEKWAATGISDLDKKRAALKNMLDAQTALATVLEEIARNG